MKIQLYDHIEQLEELRPAWNRLWSQTPHANFFHSLPWLSAYWKHYGENQKLQVLTVTEEGDVSAIVPLVIKRETTRLGSMRFLTYPLDHWGAFFGPLARNPTAALAAGLSYLGQMQRDWDVLELRWVGVAERECSEMRQVLSEAGLSPVTTLMETTSTIDLQGTWENYLSDRGSKWRNNLRRWERRLNEEGQVRYERFRSPGPSSDPRWDLFELCCDIASRSWQGSSQSGTTLSHAEIRAFLRDAHQAAADCGCLDVNLLYLDDRAVAFAYNYQYQGHVFGLRIGYDPTFKSKGVGNLLYAKTIEDSFARGDWRYDMGPGSIQIKRHLQNQTLPICRLSCFKRLSLRQQILRWKRQRDARSLPLSLEDPAGDGRRDLTPVAASSPHL